MNTETGGRAAGGEDAGESGGGDGSGLRGATLASVVALSATDARAGADETFSLEKRVLVTSPVGFGEGGGTYCA